MKRHSHFMGLIFVCLKLYISYMAAKTHEFAWEFMNVNFQQYVSFCWEVFRLIYKI